MNGRQLDSRRMENDAICARAEVAEFSRSRKVGCRPCKLTSLPQSRVDTVATGTDSQPLSRSAILNEFDEPPVDSPPYFADYMCLGSLHNSRNKYLELGPLSSEDQSLGLSAPSACLPRVSSLSTIHVVRSFAGRVVPSSVSARLTSDLGVHGRSDRPM